jgi:hypothetical protein
VRRRVWTPDAIILVGSAGERMLRMSPKRQCDRCSTALGDPTEAEMVAETYGRTRGKRLRPVHGECALCLGFHVLFADPEPIEPGGNLAEGVITVKLLCPGKPAGVSVEPCAEWARCGCETPAGVEPLTVEWVEFLAAPCPTSPTGEHRHLVEYDRDDTGPYVAAPQPGTCSYMSRYRSSPLSLAERVGHIILQGPGMYPVEIEAIDPDTLVFESVEITHGKPAEVIPV